MPLLGGKQRGEGLVETHGDSPGSGADVGLTALTGSSRRWPGWLGDRRRVPFRRC